MASLDVNVSVECSECGRPLDVMNESDGHDRYGWKVLVGVSPCAFCFKGKYDEGYEDGMSAVS